MLTHFETLITLIGIVIGLLGTLIGTVWKARGWVDQLNATDGRLADAIEALTRTQQQQHEENQRRLLALERRGWDAPRGRGRLNEIMFHVKPDYLMLQSGARMVPGEILGRLAWFTSLARPGH